MSAQYGDGSYAGSLSGDSTLTVVQSTAAVRLSGSAASPVTGRSITFTTTVATPSGNTLMSGGSVELQAYGTDLPGCSAVPLDGATTAQCVVPAGFAPSQQMVIASDSGDAAFNAASAFALTLSVTPAAITITLSTSASLAVYGTDVTVQARIAAVAPETGTPMGTVQFSLYDGTYSHKTACGQTDLVQLSGGLAACVLTAAKDLTKSGNVYTMTADYSGNADYQAGSSAMQQQVGLIETKTKVRAQSRSPKPSDSVAVAVTVSPKTGALTLESGQLVVTVPADDGSTAACVGLTLSGGTASCTIVAGSLSSTAGTYTVAAAYSGTDSFATSSDSTAVAVRSK